MIPVGPLKFRAWSGRGNTPSEKTSSEYWPELVKKHDLGFLEDGHASKADLEEKFWEDLAKKTRCKKAGNSSKGRKKKPAVKFDHDCGMYRNKKRERRVGLVGKFGMFPSDDDDVVLMNPDPPPCQGTKDGNSVCENPDKSAPEKSPGDDANSPPHQEGEPYKSVCNNHEKSGPETTKSLSRVDVNKANPPSYQEREPNYSEKGWKKINYTGTDIYTRTEIDLDWENIHCQEDFEEQFFEDLEREIRCQKASGKCSKGRKKKPDVVFDYDSGMAITMRESFGFEGKFEMFFSDDDDDDDDYDYVALMNPDPPPCQGTKDGNSLCENPDKREKTLPNTR